MSTGEPLLKAILHVHTHWSRDASLSPERLIQCCIDEGVDTLAITDHNEIEGAKEVAARAPFTVIVGEEIRTREGGEIIGLFLKERIPPHRPVLETIERIRAQEGLVYLPHPYDEGRGKRFASPVLDAIAPRVDIVETFNARNRDAEANVRAHAYATRHNRQMCAGADAHVRTEIGRTILYMPHATSAREFLAALLNAEIHEHPNPWWVHVASGLCRFRSHPRLPADGKRV